jgi:NAD(P)-dependent dehydrogenase (short-subunit alcohol dehydrogenase family)
MDVSQPETLPAVDLLHKKINMKTVLITGANKSIGFETARQLLQQGYYVYLGSRDIKKGQQAVSRLHSEGLDQVEAIQIDVDQIASIKAARELLGGKTKVLDVLINNAGIPGKMPQTPPETDISIVKQVFETNFFGVIEVTQVFIDLLRQSPEPRIVNVTSGLGSLTLHNDPAWKHFKVKPVAYVTSKAALSYRFCCQIQPAIAKSGRRWFGTDIVSERLWVFESLMDIGIPSVSWLADISLSGLLSFGLCR